MQAGSKARDASAAKNQFLSDDVYISKTVHKNLKILNPKQFSNSFLFGNKI
jgi:hypothetical protein